MTCCSQIRLVGGAAVPLHPRRGSPLMSCYSSLSILDIGAFGELWTCPAASSPLWVPSSNLTARARREKAFSDRTALQRVDTQGWYMYMTVLEFKLLAELVQTGAWHRLVREVVSVLLDERGREGSLARGNDMRRPNAQKRTMQRKALLRVCQRLSLPSPRLALPRSASPPLPLRFCTISSLVI